MKINFGILGAGRIAKIHCKNIHNHSDCKVSKIFDVNKKASISLSRKYQAEVCLDDNSIFKDKNINAVLIASSTPTHIKYLELANQYNKDVYCEKPIHLNLDTVDKCLLKLKNHKNKIQIGFHRRFDISHAELKKRILSKKYGQIEQINISSRDSALPPISYLKVSGGIFKDMTIHDLDVARWLLDDEIVEVYAQGTIMTDKKLNKVPDFDTASIILKSKKGVLCQLTNSRRLSSGFDQRIEVYCEKGNLNLSNFNRTTVTETFSKGELKDSYPFSFIERYHDAYVNALNYFISCIKKNIKPIPSLVDGRNSLAIAEALTLSAKYSRKEKVSLK